MGDDGFAYLVDFGAVQDQAALTGVTFTVVGTCGYAPLEQFWGRAVPASDLYALGATLIHLLTGLAPVNLPQRNSRIEFAEAAPQLSPFFTAWLEKLTETALEKRFSSAKEALQALNAKEMTRSQPQRPSRKLMQPDRSRTQLRRSEGTMQIYLPSPEGWNKLSKVFKPQSWVAVYIFLMAGTALSKMFVPLVFGSLGLSVFCMLLFSGTYGYILVKEACENTELTFEGDRLSIVRRSVRFLKPKKKIIPIDNIVGVFTRKVNDRYHVILRIEGDNPQVFNFQGNAPVASNWRIRQPMLYQNSSQLYHYDIGGWLSELEALWLVQEIQDWLSGRD